MVKHSLALGLQHRLRHHLHCHRPCMAAAPATHLKRGWQHVLVRLISHHQGYAAVQACCNIVSVHSSALDRKVQATSGAASPTSDVHKGSSISKGSAGLPPSNHRCAHGNGLIRAYMVPTGLAHFTHSFGWHCCSCACDPRDHVLHRLLPLLQLLVSLPAKLPFHLRLDNITLWWAATLWHAVICSRSIISGTTTVARTTCGAFSCQHNSIDTDHSRPQAQGSCKDTAAAVRTAASGSAARMQGEPPTIRHACSAASHTPHRQPAA